MNGPGPRPRPECDGCDGTRQTPAGVVRVPAHPQTSDAGTQHRPRAASGKGDAVPAFGLETLGDAFAVVRAESHRLVRVP